VAGVISVVGEAVRKLFVWAGLFVAIVPIAVLVLYLLANSPLSERDAFVAAVWAMIVILFSPIGLVVATIAGFWNSESKRGRRWFR
jgi:hypothetical protein